MTATGAFSTNRSEYFTQQVSPPLLSAQCTIPHRILFAEGGFVQLYVTVVLRSDLNSSSISVCCHLERAGPGRYPDQARALA